MNLASPLHDTPSPVWKPIPVALSCAKSVQSCLALCDPVDCITRQAPLSMGFSRQEYWSGLPCPSPGDLPHPGINPTSLTSPALAGGFFTTSTTWEATSLLFPSWPPCLKLKGTPFFSCINGTREWSTINPNIILQLCLSFSLCHKD